MGIIEEKNNIYDLGEVRGALKDEMESILNGKEPNIDINNNDFINYNGVFIYQNYMLKMENDGVIKKNFSFEEQNEILHLLKEDIKNGVVVLTEEQLSIINELDKKLNFNLEEDKQRIL